MHLLQPILLLLSWTLTSAGLALRVQQPPESTNLLDFLDSFPQNTGDRCSTVVGSYGDDPYLAYPNARIVHQSSGTIDFQTRLRVRAPSGYRFSVNWVTLSAYLQLEPGALMERINVSVGYHPGDGKADVATARNLYGRGATGYDGRFNLSIPVVPSVTDGKLGSTGCPSSADDLRSWISIYLFISLTHEMVGFDDNTPHYGTLGGNSLDEAIDIQFDGFWEQC